MSLIGFVSLQLAPSFQTGSARPTRCLHSLTSESLGNDANLPTTFTKDSLKCHQASVYSYGDFDSEFGPYQVVWYALAYYTESHLTVADIPENG